MAFKFVAFFACLAFANAGLLHQPIAAPVAEVRSVVDAEYDPNPQYSYSYGVSDSITGDNHGQVESRNGDVVTGQYSLVDADGSRRTVDYSADPINGFNAVVSRTPIGGQVVAAGPAVVEARAAQVVAAPAVSIARAAPVVAAPALSIARSYAPAARTIVAGPSVYSSHVSAPASVAYTTSHIAAPAVVARTIAAPAHLSYAAPAHVSYAAPQLSYAAPQLSYAAAAPLAYSSYSSPILRYAH